MHERLHGHPAFQPVLDATADASAYAGLLTRLYGFHEPLEQALHAAPSPWWFGLRPSNHRLVHRLESDLAHFAIDPGGLARMRPPVISTAGHLLGTLYVREGAMLGGRVLARKLDELLGGSSQGRQFFTGSPRDRDTWARTCDALERAGAAGHLDDMIASARATFAEFEAWFEGQGCFAPDGRRR